jgi:uncharacterized membrane protein
MQARDNRTVRTVRATTVLPGTVHEAERLWYDTGRWPTWVDGLARIDRVQGSWPLAGATVIWDSTPAGRGRVVERSVAHEPLQGHTAEVEDETLRGVQEVTFTPKAEDQVEVELSLSYEIKRRNPFTPAVDVLFVRRAMTDSLQKTLRRFAIELSAERRGLGI